MTDPSPVATQRAERMRSMLDAMAAELGSEAVAAEDPRYRALAGTASEVVGGLGRGFRHYETKSEAAWR
jgi:hypothetical protein